MAKWECISCSHENDTPLLACDLCDTERTVSDDLEVAALSQPEGSAVPEVSFPLQPLVQEEEKVLFPWQQLALAELKQKNTIVMIPTGGGKTLVGVRAIDHFLSKHPGKKALFVVPTVALVHQQADYCYENCVPVKRVANLASANIGSWDKERWSVCLAQYDILVAVAAVFANACRSGRLDVTQLCLAVFDECHAAVGNSPMVSIMSHITCTLPEKSQRPHIVGLTGSFNNGAMRNIETKRSQLEARLTANLCCPNMGDFIELQKKTYITITFDSTDLLEAKSVIEETTQSLIQPWLPQLREAHRIVLTANAVFLNFGRGGWLYYMREGIFRQLPELVGVGSEEKKLDRTRALLRGTADTLTQLQAIPWESNKFKRLVELFAEKQKEFPNMRALIFVERVASTAPLADMLSKSFAMHNKLQGLNVAAVAGTGGMKDKERERILDSFRSGALSVLVSTPSLEEGIDVAECNFVVRFDEFHTCKQHIQGSGRARSKNAQIFYFVNKVREELKKEQRMDEVAKDENLALTEAEIEEEVLASLPYCKFHPYFHGGCTIDVFSALTMVYEYVQKVMQQGVNFEDLMDFNEFALSPRKLERVSYPSPDGLISVDRAQYDAIWGDTKLSDVAPKERIKNWNGEEKDKRCFMFVVARDMAERSYLDYEGQPVHRALYETKLKCSAYTLKPGVRLQNRYKPEQNLLIQPNSPLASLLSPLRLHLSPSSPASPSPQSDSFQIVRQKLMILLDEVHGGRMLIGDMDREYGAKFEGGTADLRQCLSQKRTLGYFLKNVCGCTLDQDWVTSPTYNAKNGSPAPRLAPLGPMSPSSPSSSLSSFPTQSPADRVSEVVRMGVRKKLLNLLDSHGGTMLVADVKNEYAARFGGIDELNSCLTGKRTLGVFFEKFCDCKVVGHKVVKLTEADRLPMCDLAISAKNGDDNKREIGGDRSGNSGSSTALVKMYNEVDAWDCGLAVRGPAPAMVLGGNYKGSLQEHLQRVFPVGGPFSKPQYDTTPVSEQEFECRLTVTLPVGARVFTGRGVGKKAADQAAAFKALSSFYS